MPTPALTARRGFALGGIPLLLFVALLGIMVVRAWLISQNLPPAGSMSAARRNGFIIGTWAAVIVAPVLALGIAWVVGKLVSLMFGRSDDAGNVGASAVMLLLAGLFAYSTYAVATAPRPPAATQASGPGGGSFVSAEQATRQELEASAAKLRAQAERLAKEQAEQLRRQGEALRSPPPATPPQTAPTSPAADPARPPAPPRQPPRQPEAPDPIVLKVRDELAAELKAKVQPAADAAAALKAQVAPLPKSDIRDLRTRLERIAAARAALVEARDTLGSIDELARDRFEKAGVDASQTTINAHRFSTEADAFTRRIAAESLLRMLEHASGEATLMRDNLGRWSYAKDGKVESKDFQLKSQINAQRFFLTNDLTRWDAEVDRLRGKGE